MDAPVTPMTAVAPDPGRVRLAPIDSRGLRIDGGMWADRRAINRSRTIPHGFEHLEASGALGNFRNAARGTGLYVGGNDDSGATFPFLDSDVYKWLEAVAWELGREEDAGLREMADAGRIAGGRRRSVPTATWARSSSCRAGRPSATCNGATSCTASAISSRPPSRGIARSGTAGCSTSRSAPWPASTRRWGPTAVTASTDIPRSRWRLVELYRITGDARHLALARHQLEQRGRGLLGQGRFGAAYWQDREPVRVAAGVTGHSVRQLYLDCGRRGRRRSRRTTTELLDAAIRRWDDMRANRTYLTGALGSRHRDEAFGPPFELPPDRAYAETCATIASVMLAWRLLLATGEERFADAIERAMLGGVLSGMSLSGTEFFYMNPLQRRPAVPPEHAAGRRAAGIPVPAARPT